MLDFSDSIMGHVEELAGRIGKRYIGSPGNHAAAEYLRREMEREGLAVELQKSDCPEWAARRAILEAEGRALQVFADPFSPPVEVAAPVVPVCTIAELSQADLRNKIVLLYGSLSSNPISPKAWFLITEREQQIIAMLEEKRPAAVLTAQPAVPYFAHGFCDAESTIPSATVPRGAALELLRGNPASVRLVLDTERRPGWTANVVGRLPGKRRETVVLCAHYDTALETAGACDNAGGAAIVLALAAHFAARPPECTLEFAAFSGHEYLPLGSEAYLRGVGPAHIVAAINFDGAGHILGTNTLCAMAASENLIRAAQSALEEYPGVAWVEPWPESDHSLFAMNGVPALAFGGEGVREIAHSPEDTVDGVSIVKLNEAASLAADIVAAIWKKPVKWGKEPSNA